MEPREQLADTVLLRPGPLSLGVGIGAAAVGIGFGVLLICWGLSWLWPHSPSRAEIAHANLERQHNPSEPDQLDRNGRYDGASNITASLAPGSVDRDKMVTRVIRRQVTEFRSIDHEAGEVTTGWQYEDGRGGVPLLQYCYYLANVPGTKHRSDRIEIAIDGRALSDLDPLSVPNLEGAEAKFQWWAAKEEQISLPALDQAPQADQQHASKP
jgi:hypothetical protein